MFFRFLNDRQGNVAVISALVILPILMLSGVGIEYSRIAATRGEIQTVVDNTVLNSGMDFSNRPAAERMLAALINANTGRDTARVDISLHQDKLRILAHDTLETPLLSTIGQTQSPIEVHLDIPAPGSTSGSQQTAAREAQGSSSENAQRLRTLKKAERQIERVIKRLKSRPGKYPQQQQKLRQSLERQLSEIRRQMRNLG